MHLWLIQFPWVPFPTLCLGLVKLLFLNFVPAIFASLTFAWALPFYLATTPLSWEQTRHLHLRCIWWKLGTKIETWNIVLKSTIKPFTQSYYIIEADGPQHQKEKVSRILPGRSKRHGGAGDLDAAGRLTAASDSAWRNKLKVGSTTFSFKSIHNILD